MFEPVPGPGATDRLMVRPLAQQPRIISTIPDVKLEITRTPMRLEIDSTVPREEIGYYTMLAYPRQIVAYSLRQAERGIADIVAAGDQLACPESGVNVIAELAVERMNIELTDNKIVLAFIPLTPPSIRFISGGFQIDWVV